MRVFTLFACVVLLIPPAVANHGLDGSLVGRLGDGTSVIATLRYVNGNYDYQTWHFAFSSPGGASCYGFGSVEIGFTSYSGCAVSWATGPTGDAHAFPHPTLDVHTISITIDGRSGSGLQTICPDTVPVGRRLPVTPPGLPRTPEPSPPRPYAFTVVIEQTAAGDVPRAGQLPEGCTFQASSATARAECRPPESVGSPNWFCSYSGVMAQATRGSVTGTTYCRGEPPAVARATAPLASWAFVRDPQWMLNPVYQFPFVCIAEFLGGATGYVLCDEPDPPVLVPDDLPRAFRDPFSFTTSAGNG